MKQFMTWTVNTAPALFQINGSVNTRIWWSLCWYYKWSSCI